MATLLAALNDHADVEWNVFGLVDDDRVEPGEPGWGALGSPTTMLTGRNGAIFRSGGSVHRAAVRLESWDGAPEPPGGAWDAVWEDEFVVTSGVLRLVAVTAGVSEVTLRIGGPGAYAVRVCCRGRDAARQAGSMPYTGEVVERWVMQFWPR
jgi:hypothetical protein